MQNLNYEKLLNSNFIDRFLGFVEKTDIVHNTYLYKSAQKWLDENDFDSIKYFLDTNASESTITFSLHQFTCMNYTEFVYFQNVYSEIATLIDEKKSLYQELISFYE